MLRKIWPILLVGLASGCVSAPQVSPCILDAANGVAYCTSVSTGKTESRKISDMTGFTAYSPGDMQILIEWIKRRLK